jgi:hypothetical protein
VPEERPLTRYTESGFIIAVGTVARTLQRVVVEEVEVEEVEVEKQEEEQEQ